MPVTSAETSRPESEIFGRDSELEGLHTRYAEALQGRGGLVLVGGEAGIGKTSLIREFIRQLGAHPPLVLAGHCIDLFATPAYGPWVEIIRNYSATGELPEVPDVLKRGTGMGEINTQIELFDVAYQFLSTIATVRPVVLVLEDLHWSDPESLNLLRYAARQASEHRILIIASYRNDEVPADHPLYQVLPLLTRESNSLRIDLRPINQHSLTELLSFYYELPTEDIERLSGYLSTHAEGNPLYLMEILRELQHKGTLRQVERGWSLGNLDRFRVPAMLQQIIDRRVTRINPDHRALLEIAAILGDEFDIDLWQKLAEVDDDTLETVVEESIDNNILVDGRSGDALSFSHALVRQAIYQQTSPLRRRRTHRRIADALINQHVPDEDSIAYHLQQAGDERAVDWLVRAGERALQTYAIPSAGDRFALAAELLQSDETRLSERGWLLYRAARQLRFTDRQRGVELLREAQRIALRVHDDVLTAFAISDRGHLEYLEGRVHDAFEHLSEGSRRIDDLPADYIESDDIRIWISDLVPRPQGEEIEDQGFRKELGHFNPRRAALTLILAGLGLLDQGIEAGEDFRNQLAQIRNPDHHILSPYADVLNGLAHIYSYRGEVEQSREAYLDAIDSMRRIKHLAFIGLTVYGLLENVILAFETDRVDERRRLERLAHRYAKDAHAEMLTDVPLDVTNFRLLYIEGRWDEALQKFLEHDDTVMLGIQRQHYLFHASIMRARGEYREANEYLDSVVPSGPRTEPLEIDLTSAFDAFILGASLAFDKDNLDAAHAWIATFNRWLIWSGSVRGLAEHALLASQFAERSKQIEPAKAHAETALEHAMSPRQPLALIQSHRQLGRLAIDAGDTESADTHLQESLALAEACSAPYEVAQTRFELARLQRTLGHADAAQQLIRLVRKTCDELGARPLREQADALEHRHPPQHDNIPLTRRERQVLELVARGRADTEIADELYIARRTVNTHLTSIFRKLDVSNRTEAAIRARKLGLIGD